MAKEINWIKLRNEYINGRASYRDLAQKYGISARQIANRGKKENWVALRREKCSEISTKLQQKTQEKILSKEAARLDRLLSLSDRLADLLERAAEEADQYLVKDTAQMEIHSRNPAGQATVMRTQSTTLKTKQGPVDKAGLKKLTAALKDIRDVQLTDTGEDQLQKLDEILEKMGGNL